MRIEGQRVVITGASSGIGRAMAFSLARRGAVLTISSRAADRLEETSREVAAACPDAPVPVAVPCDVSNASNVSVLIGGVVERLGAVDVLVNNAGISVYGETELTPVDDFRAMMSVNFFGALNCMREVLPFMKRRERGLIVNVASVAALHGVPYLGAYGASKAALVAVSQSLRAELSESGVRIMIVYPGYTDTDIFARESKVGGARRPDGPYAPAADVAEAIVRGMEAGGRDLVLTAQGKVLSALRGVAPSFVERAMRKIAGELRDVD